MAYVAIRQIVPLSNNTIPHQKVIQHLLVLLRQTVSRLGSHCVARVKSVVAGDVATK